jgi:hypothetical protein
MNTVIALNQALNFLDPIEILNQAEAILTNSNSTAPNGQDREPQPAPVDEATL